MCGEGGSWEGLYLSVAVSGSWEGEQGRVCGKEVWRGVEGRDFPGRAKLEEGAAPRFEASGSLDGVVQQCGTRVRWELHPWGSPGALASAAGPGFLKLGPEEEFSGDHKLYEKSYKFCLIKTN